MAIPTMQPGAVEMARLFILAWDIPGRCDIRAMTHVINTYLRRHDTYHSWFDYKGADNIVRRTIRDPKDIKLVPTKHGEITPAEWRDHVLATPDPLRWDCFRFGVIQRADHFTFYTSCRSCPHRRRADGSGLGGDSHDVRRAGRRRGADPVAGAGSYDDYCVRQHQYITGSDLGLTGSARMDRVRQEQRRNPSAVPTATGCAIGAHNRRRTYRASSGRRADGAIRIRVRGGGRPFQWWRICLRCHRGA